MQILCIRGGNIASLAQAFELRLDQAPLASAGLFAITGETGAGKSSLLDAMCLALYGTCPRLSGEGTRESVEEADGQDLKSNDPRMILRRGAGEGHAEVTFLATDGQVYAAAWCARRARGRLDGRLQAVERSLRRLPDGQVLETQARAVNDRIVALTGLTYDEFRRTVLLAQGDFDAFLSAKTADRAAILEKVTGTGIYRDISRRVFDRHGAARTALETLEARRAEHRLLTPEQRAELAAAADALRAAQAADDATAATVKADLAQWHSLTAARARRDEAAARLHSAQAALTALHPDRDWLRDWDAARLLRGEVAAREDRRTALAAARDRHAALSVRLQDQTALLARATATVAAATAQRDAAEARFKSFAEAWTRATELDAMILTAGQETATAGAELDRLTRLSDGAAAESSALADAKARLETALAARQATLAGVPGHGALLSNWALLEERLDRRITLSDEVSTLTGRQTALRQSIAGDRAALDALAARIVVAEDGLKAAQAHLAAIAPERDALLAENPGVRAQGLAQAALDLRALRQAAAALAAAEAARSESRRCCDDARAEAARAATEAQAAEQAAGAARQVIDALRRPAETASAAVSAEAAHLRRHLMPGQPCPVCQATDHPLLADGALAALAHDLRQRLARAEADRDAALRSALSAQARGQQAQTVIAAEAALAPQRDADLARATREMEAARLALADHDIGPLPDGLHVPAAVLDDLADRLALDRQAAARAQARLAALDRQHLDSAQATDTARAAITQAEAAQRKTAQAIAETERALAALDQSIPARVEDIARIDDRLSPLMHAFGDRPDAYGAGAAPALAGLRQTVTHLAALTEALRQDGDRLAAMLPALATATEATASALRARDAAAAVLSHRHARLSELRADRAALLDGEDTASHRTRHNDLRRTAQTALETAQRAEADARTAHAELTGAVLAAAEAVADATDRAARADAALDAACAAVNLTPAHVLALHAAPEEEVTRRRLRLTAATTELAEASGALRDRAAELATRQAAPLPALSAEALTDRQGALDAAAAARSEDLGRIAERLDADGQAVLALSGLEAEITAARQTAETWAAVNDAVGSASGDRFAQIAQAVTLAQLVECANLHLNDLKPRYQLEVASTDLALQVIDLDMAGDRRPARLLSGGERFLVSLALALALSGMGTRGALAGTLFIDEGFGSLDADSLDLAIDALEQLQAQGRMIGVISHVQAMKDRIPVQVEVRKIGGGASEVRLKVQ